MSVYMHDHRFRLDVSLCFDVARVTGDPSDVSNETANSRPLPSESNSREVGMRGLLAVEMNPLMPFRSGWAFHEVVIM